MGMEDIVGKYIKQLHDQIIVLNLGNTALWLFRILIMMLII